MISRRGGSPRSPNSSYAIVNPFACASRTSMRPARLTRGAPRVAIRTMARYFHFCAHEQFAPDDLLRQAVEAEHAGFDGIGCSDHLQPWWEPGESGHAWIWLGAAAQATERVPVGPAVTVGLKRYHPALIAQGFATLELMYPGRVFVGLGSGESLNESPLGLDWPAPRDQLPALEETRRP